jgi:hypothetical protein
MATSGGVVQQATVTVALAVDAPVSATTATPITGMALTLGVGKWVVLGTITVDSGAGGNVETGLVAGTATCTIVGGGGDTATAGSLTTGRSFPCTALVTVTVAGTIQPTVYATTAQTVKAVGPVNAGPGVSNLTAMNTLV